MGRKIPFFVKGGALKNNTDTSHGISVFSHGENPTEFFCIVCLIPKIFNGKNRATRSFAEMKKIFF
jgi:enhancing lycopene biosynthesis protein 2